MTPLLRGAELVDEPDGRHPTAGALAADEWTCRALLSLSLQAQRGGLWGNTCRTLNQLPAGGGESPCSYCGQPR